MAKFRIACHVCTWGEFTASHIEPVFRQIADAGYEGVEGFSVNSTDELVDIAALAHSFGLHVVMAHSRTPGQTIRYNAALGNRTCEVWQGYVEDYGWPGVSREEMFNRISRYFEPIFKEASRYGIGLHQHIHLNQPMETIDDIELMLGKMPKMGILLDTGHLVAAGGNAMDVLSKYGDRIPHVHLKDFHRGPSWDVKNKTFEENYFVPLGQGNCGLDVGAVLRKLEEIDYDGWVSLELDYMGPLRANNAHVGTLIKQNREFVRSQGY